jgi:hypothetical protein
LETLVKPSDNSKISLPLQNSEGSFILSNDNQTFDLSFKPAGSTLSLSGLTYNATSGLTVNNDIVANSVNTPTLSVSGLNIIDELNTKATTTALTNGLSSKVNTSTFTTANNQKADLSLVNTIVGLQTLINNNIETILPIESNGSSTKFRFRVGNNALRIEKFDNVGSVVLDDWVTVLTLSLDDANLPILMLGDLNVKSELASKASISYVNNAIANVQPVSGGSSVLTNYVSPLEASLVGLNQYSLYRTNKTLRLHVKPPTQYGIKLSSASSITWSNVALVPDNSFTFETWFYSDRAGGAPTLLDIRGNNKSITVNKDGGGRLQILSNDANLNLNVNGYVPPTGQWIHLAVQNDVPNNIFRVYVNGDSTLLNSAPGISGWSSVSSVTVSMSMSEGYNIFSNIRLSLGAVYGISTFVTKTLPLDKNNATKFLVQGNTTNDIIQNKQGGFIGSVILETLSDSLITETATDGDIQVVKVTANDVKTNNLGISKKSNNANIFSVVDQTTLGGTTFDPVIVAGVPMTCTSVSCTSLTVAGVPITGGSGVSNLINYSDDISASIANLADYSLYHSSGIVRYKLPAYLSEYYLGDGRITMNPTTGLTNLQNQTVWTIEMWFRKNEFNYANNTLTQVLFDTRPIGVGGNTPGILIRLETNGTLTYADTGSDSSDFFLARPVGTYAINQWQHLILQRNGNGVNVYCNGTWTSTTNSNPQFKFNGITMNTIANIPTHTGYRTNATVSGLRFSSGNRYVGGSPVTASRKEVERTDANTVFLMTDNFKDVISGNIATPVSVTETRANLLNVIN